jgi:hypothetical protein
MVRGICGAIMVMSMLAHSAAAQPFGIGTTPSPQVPALANTSPATLGDPRVQTTAGTGQADVPALTTSPPTVMFTGSYTTLPRPSADSANPLGDTPLPSCADAGNLPRPIRSWFENMSLFAGLDGFKEPADLGVNANFGYRLAFNWGFAAFEDVGIGVQVGTSVNYSENALRLLRFIDGTVDHWQNFTTFGVFQRTTGGLHWGVVYDFRFDDYYDRTQAGQWRAQVGQ